MEREKGKLRKTVRQQPQRQSSPSLVLRYPALPDPSYLSWILRGLPFFFQVTFSDTLSASCVAFFPPFCQQFSSNGSLSFTYFYPVSFFHHLFFVFDCFRQENKSGPPAEGLGKSITENDGPMGSFHPFASFWITSSRRPCQGGNMRQFFRGNKWVTLFQSEYVKIKMQTPIASCFPEFLIFPVALSTQYSLCSFESTSYDLHFSSTASHFPQNSKLPAFILP